MIYEITDPGAAGEDIEILDQDVVHLGSEPFSVRRVVVNLDKSKFVLHSVSHRAGTDKLTSQVEKACKILVILDHCTFPRRKGAQPK